MTELDLELVKSTCTYIHNWHHQFDDPNRDRCPTQAETDCDHLIDLCRTLVAEVERCRRGLEAVERLVVREELWE